MVHYNTVLYITQFKDGSQKCIDYIEKYPFMVIFQYNLYIFVWILHGCLTNTVYAMDPNNSVIKRLWCSCPFCFDFTCGHIFQWQPTMLSVFCLFVLFYCLEIHQDKRMKFCVSKTGLGSAPTVFLLIVPRQFLCCSSSLCIGGLPIHDHSACYILFPLGSMSPSWLF